MGQPVLLGVEIIIYSQRSKPRKEEEEEGRGGNRIMARTMEEERHSENRCIS